MPDRDLALDAKLSLALGWKLYRLAGSQFLADLEPASGAVQLDPSELDVERLHPHHNAVPALSTDPAQVVERMAERGWRYEILGRDGWTLAVFANLDTRGEEVQDECFSLAIAKAALSALEAERESQKEEER